MICSPFTGLDIMTARSKSVYASVPFKFIIDGEPLYIHADVVSLHSKPLDRLMNGYMGEAQKGFATLPDVDEATFVRFIEWAYKGYYTAAEFSTVEEEDRCAENDQGSDSGEVHIAEPLPEVTAPNNGGWGGFGIIAEPLPEVTAPDDGKWGGFGITKKAKKKGKVESPDHPAFPTAREDLKISFISRISVERKRIPTHRRNQRPSEVYRDVFLSRARLYVFADKYDIQPLKMSALDELHQALVVFTLYSQRTGDIIDLLRYVYTNTSETREGVEDIRTLMMSYVGFEMDILMGDPRFRSLMIEDPELEGLAIEDRRNFWGDYMTMVHKRISSGK